MSAAQRDAEPNPVDTTGLCLLSLDGGGVRGLSSLYVLKSLMAQLNQARKAANLPSVKPCEVFDLIGGTSTGGLIAIMLGRLEMDVDECILEYNNLMKAVFEEKSSSLPVRWTGKIKAQFASAKLESAIKGVIQSKDVSTVDGFNDGKLRGCRTFVCAAAKETAGVTRLRSYTLPEERDLPATICQAALATSAATGFFDPVSIDDRQFVDGALGANNPVDEVEGEAANIWCSETGDLKPIVKCFVSVGTGNPGKKAMEDNMFSFLSKTLPGIVTETENTERKFVARWAKHFDDKRYFRFNVDQGLQDVGLAEYKEQGRIKTATDEFLGHQAQKFRIRDFVHNLRAKHSRTDANFAAAVQEHNSRIIHFCPSVRKACWTVPFARNPRFVSRGFELNKAEDSLFTSDGTPKIAITGLGGVGKTQIVIELAYRTKEKYPECSIFWILATNTESLQEAYLDIGRRMAVPGLQEKQADIKQLIQQHLSQESAGQWLLIFDNADDMDLWIQKDGNGKESDSWKDYLPRSRRGRIAFTTRNRKIAVKLAQADVIEVLEMKEEAATQLLSKSLIKQELLIDHQVTQKLLNQLTFLPLAIVQAANYINENGITPSDYSTLLEEQESDVVDLLSEKFDDEGRYRDVRNPVITTWLISFEHIRRLDPLAAEYLSFMSCVDPKNIPQSLLPPARSRKQETDAIGTLNAYAFVSRQPGDHALNIHRLVHLATRNWLRREGSLTQWLGKAVKRLEEVFPTDDHENRSIWRAYLAHARYVLEDDEMKEGKVGGEELMWRFALCLSSDGRYNEAENWLWQVTETRKKVLGEEHLNTLNSMGNLAILYSSQGRWKKAEELQVRVLEISKRVLGEEHPDTLNSMANLASTYWNQKRWKEAEELEVRVLEIRKRVLGEEHPDTLSSISNLASTYSNQGRWKEAEELEVRVLDIQKRVLGEEHPDTLNSMANLASTYWNQKYWKEAEELEIRVLEIRKRVLGEEHPDTLISMSNLALTYWKQKRWKEAEELGVRVLELRKRVLGEEHPDTLKSIANLASTYWNQKRWKEAEELEVRVLEIRKRVLGEEHPDTLIGMANLAHTLKSQSRMKDAISLMKKCLELRKRILSLEHPDTQDSLRALNEWEDEEHDQLTQ